MCCSSLSFFFHIYFPLFFSPSSSRPGMAPMPPSLIFTTSNNKLSFKYQTRVALRNPKRVPFAFFAFSSQRYDLFLEAMDVDVIILTWMCLWIYESLLLFEFCFLASVSARLCIWFLAESCANNNCFEAHQLFLSREISEPKAPGLS